ncbi:MAG TPA: NUDIX domain-containing protein, partial [Anaerolineae bacterium]|nr:NUDIX domain-containing protein [Anaerolineae bacterium]
MPKFDEKSCGAVIFKEEDGQILYLTVEYKKEKGYWGLVKGHVEAGESELETAKREIYEEVGLSDLNFYPGFRAEHLYQPKPGVTKLVVFFQ